MDGVLLKQSIARFGGVDKSNSKGVYMPVADAEKFLELVEKNKKVRDKVKALSHITELGKEHDLSFTNADLSRALKQKWGVPAKRRQAKSESFTCCCI